MNRLTSLIFLAFACVQALAFAPSTSLSIGTGSSMKSLSMMEPSYDFVDASSTTIAAATIDPTTALSQVLGGLLGSPAILLVPILAAFGVASAIAFFIVSYANPADPDE